MVLIMEVVLFNKYLINRITLGINDQENKIVMAYCT